MMQRTIHAKDDKAKNRCSEEWMQRRTGKNVSNKQQNYKEKGEGLFMRKYSKAAVSGFMAVMMAAAALSGCSGGKSSNETAAKTEAAKTEAAKAEKTEAAGKGEETKAAAESEGEPVTLRFVSWQTNHDAGNRAVADAYHAEHPNVTVEFEYLGDMNSKDYLTKTDIMLMGGEAMDIVMTPDFASFAARAASGSYLALDPYFDETGTKAEDEFNVIIRNDGQVYGIPAEMKYNMMLINKNMLDEAGLEVPPLDWTWDDYRDYAIKLTKGSGADTIYGSYFHLWGSANLHGVASAKKGSTFFNDDGTLTFDNPYFAKFLQWRYDLENTDKASVPLADVKALNLNYRDLFFSGKLAMFPGGTFMLSDIGNEKYQHDFVTTFARMPMWEKDGEHYNVAASNMFCIARTSEHPKEAFDFLKYWCKEGVAIKGMFVSNEKGADRMESINKIVGNFTDLVDMDALKNVMQDEKWVDSYEEFTPTYQSEIDSLLTEETDKYLLGSQSLEDTIQRLMDRGNEVIAENK